MASTTGKQAGHSPDDVVVIHHSDVGGGKKTSEVTREQFEVVYEPRGWKITSEADTVPAPEPEPVVDPSLPAA